MTIMLPRHAELWLADYLRSVIRARRETERCQGVVDILFAVADHFEPLHGGVSDETGRRRVKTWLDGLPAVASSFVDSDGRHPQHTFFYPIEQYRPDLLDSLATLCQRGFGEVEVHLHHDGDTARHLRAEFEGFAQTLHHRHGLLCRDELGALRYAFVHGNWALSNSLPGGRWCGVDDELAVLRDTGCYADFTLPAAPSAAQTSTVNQIYYAAGAPPGPRGHERGVRAAVGRPPSPEDLLLVQGPLALQWRNAKWGTLPRLDNSSLHAGYPPTIERFSDWVSCRICVAGRPEWVFVKVYTHGGPEANAEVLLGPEMAAFHRDVLTTFNDGERFRLHYVTTREIVNIIHAAEDGKTGNPGQDPGDYRLAPPTFAQSGRGAGGPLRVDGARPLPFVASEGNSRPVRSSSTSESHRSLEDPAAGVSHPGPDGRLSEITRASVSTGLRGLGITLERLSRVVGHTGAWAALSRAVPWRGVLCLNYHRVGDATRDGFDQGVWSANAAAFDDQMRFLKLNVDVIGPHDLPDVVRGRKGRHVLLTFDDGYVDNYRIAFPILKSRGVPAIFFVATGFVDHPRIPWWDEIAWMVRSSRSRGIPANRWMTTQVVFDEAHRERAVKPLLGVYKATPTESGEAFLDFLGEATGCGRYDAPDYEKSWMTWEMLREVRSAGMFVGGHTVSHPVLSHLPIDRQWEEISGCALRLSQELGEPMRYFSYPVGSRVSFNSDTRACLQRVGVEYAFSYYGGLCRFNEWDDLDVRRTAVAAHMSSHWVRALVTLPGLYARAR